MNNSFDLIINKDNLKKFKVYEELVRQWNQSFSLVQSKTLSEFQLRHILDSIQIIPLILLYKQKLAVALINDFSLLDDNKVSQHIEYIQLSGKKIEEFIKPIESISILDIGSGAGLPGLPLAILGFQNITLVESNHKKCLFLEEAARSLNAKVMVLSDRAENINDKYEIVLSRAALHLSTLLSLMYNVMIPTTIGIFHKGRMWKDELNDALLDWSFDCQIISSLTSPDGVLILISNLVKR